jgi:hypothetical protein
MYFRISEHLPSDINNLILSLWNEKYPDAEIVKMLPPTFVRDGLLAEKGVIAPRGDAQHELVRDWFARQHEVQTAVAKTHQLLMETEPLTQEMAIRGELPAWSVKPWAVTMLFDWSADLEDALGLATEYLDSRKAPTR